MWRFLVAQGCKLAWKVCLWENEGHLSNGSVSYRYMESYLFPLVILWNVFHSGKVVYQAHPWKKLVSPPILILSNCVRMEFSWVPGVVVLFLSHQACPRHELTVVAILLLYWLMKKLPWHSAQRCQRYREEENLPLGKACFYNHFSKCILNLLV